MSGGRGLATRTLLSFNSAQCFYSLSSDSWELAVHAFHPLLGYLTLILVLHWGQSADKWLVDVPRKAVGKQVRVPVCGHRKPGLTHRAPSRPHMLHSLLLWLIKRGIRFWIWTRTRTRTGNKDQEQVGGQAAGSWCGTHAHREMFCSSSKCDRAGAMQAYLQPMTAAKNGAPCPEKKAASCCLPARPLALSF